MFFKNKKTKVDLTGSTLSAVRHVQQAIEVLTGEYVELDHVPIVHGPIQRRVPRSHCPASERYVEIECEGRLYPSQQFFTFEMSMWMAKKDKSIATRWEISAQAGFSLILGDGVKRSYSVKWKYFSLSIPEVWVIDQSITTGPSPEKAMWKVGRDRTERREQPLSMFD